MLRKAYCPPAAESRVEPDDDDDASWSGAFGAQEAPSADSTRPPSSESTQEDERGEENLEDEWDAVAERTDVLRLEHKANFGKIQVKDDPSSLQISYKEVQDWISQLSSEADVLRPLENQAFGLARLKPKLPGSDRQRGKGKELVLQLRAMPFDFNTPTHFRMLRTIYTKLTLNKWCPSIGNHWEVLGFQSGDPRTDLNRSGGVLNILHMFFFLTHHLELAKSCFQLSQDDLQNFPLACISINISSLVMESLAAGRLSSLCSKESGDQGAFEVTCRLHSAGLSYFCSRWRTQKRTIEHTEQTRNEVKALLDRKPAKLLQELTQAAAAAIGGKQLVVTNFADLEAISAAAQAGSANQHRGLWARSKAAVLPKRLRRYADENAHSSLI